MLGLPKKVTKMLDKAYHVEANGNKKRQQRELLVDLVFWRAVTI